MSERSAEKDERARDFAARVVAHHLGSAPHSLEREGSGLTNFVYAAEHGSGRYVVRIALDPARIAAFRKERWAAARAAQEGVPVPVIVELGSEVVPCAYMILERARGEEATGHAERTPIVEALGAYARRINAIATQGYGHVFDWAGPELPRHASWHDYLERELSLGERLLVLTRHGMLDNDQATRVRESMESMGADRRAMALNHGDLRLKNVVVDEAGRITAVLDWENAISGPAPEWELSLALHDLSVDEKEAFLAGYALSPEEVERHAAALKALNLVNYAPFVRRAARAGDEDKLARYRARLRGALDLHSV